MDADQEEQPASLRSFFETANTHRQILDTLPSPTSTEYQSTLTTSIAAFQKCLHLTDSLAIFSPNETEDDISTPSLQYLLLHHHLGDLILRITSTPRKPLLLSSRTSYEKFLKLLDNYDMLSPSDSKLYSRYSTSPDDFSLLSSTDPTARRNTKIARYRQEQELRMKLEYLASVPLTLQQQDDAATREIYLAEIQLCAHNSFHALDIIGQELKILALMPETPPSPTPQDLEQDHRQRNGIPLNNRNENERLDPPLSQLLNNGKAGPILSKEGRPLKPFTLLDSRQRMRDGVFKADHALPTMTIDEYLAEEKRRGGIVDGGGQVGATNGVVDEDDVEEADRATMKAREWDEFVEANPKGSGNTLNRG